MSQQQRSINAVFYDEEDCLGFGVFVAELELILGTSRDRRPDQVQLLELLQKLQASISTSESSVLKKHQNRCEAALYDIIYKGGCGVVRTQHGLLVHATAATACMLCTCFYRVTGVDCDAAIAAQLSTGHCSTVLQCTYVLFYDKYAC